MIRLDRLAVLSLASAAMFLAEGPAHALTFVIGNFPTQIYLRVGRTGATDSLVTFTVTPANAGSGPINGTAPANAGARSAAQTPNFPDCPANNVRIVARARANPANSRTATLSVSSTGTLSAGVPSIPLTKIDWLSDSPEIPAGVFSGIAGQALTSFQNSREVGACLQFRFLNDTVYPPGTYTGSVTYNLSMP